MAKIRSGWTGHHRRRRVAGVGRVQRGRRARWGRKRAMRRGRRESVPDGGVRAVVSRVGLQARVLGHQGAVVTVLPPVGSTTTRA